MEATDHTSGHEPGDVRRVDGPAGAEDDVVARARAWLEVDPDPVTRAELEDLLDAGDTVGLTDRFGHRLTFGTAGLRGALGAGPNRMNRVLVRMAAGGLVEHVGRSARYVIGHDARTGSDDFARDTAGVVASRGGRALLFDGLVPTPVLAHAVRHLDADAGVMVTASHNPPGDNGYKVYLGDGAQLVPPSDRRIEASIAAEPLPPLELPPPAAGGTVELVGQEVVDAYVEATAPERPVDLSGLTVAYTALHGVGGELVRRVLGEHGAALVEVAEQAEPDGSFPTVGFPNPEEPGALDLLLALARSTGADVALANDPDADRLSVSVPTGAGWRTLSGDEVGVLLGDHLLRHGTGDDRLVVTTVVSSSLLARIARHHGVHFAETLTGFKWVVRPGLEHPERRFVFGYEEALGYAVNDVVRDKDGISAALVFAELVAELRADGSTVLDRLDELARHHGVVVSGGTSVRFEGADATQRMAEAMGRLRASLPDRIADVEVVEVRDFLDGDGPAPTDLVRLVLADGSRLQFRPSGTEPKLKLYAEATSPPTAGDDLDAIRRHLAEWRTTLLDAGRHLLT